MAAARVVEALDELEDRHTYLRVAPESLPPQQLGLERGEEAFGDGVIKAIAGGSCGRQDPELPAPLAELDRGVLGGFNWSLQHLEMEVFNDGSKQSC